MTTGAQTPLQSADLLPLGLYPAVALLGHIPLWGNLSHIFRDGYTSFYSNPQGTRVPFPLHPRQHVLCQVWGDLLWHWFAFFGA